ncbi:hypothetical protein [Rheinheimera sp.]|uniref:hypothetical protein n=1 Tax=Rheinheimera sp. TaxID=1869214 RepID=UPI004047600C
MKYLLISALLLCGAFFSHAQTTDSPLICSNGGTLSGDKCIQPAQGVSGWTLTVSPGYPYAGYKVEARTKAEAQAVLGAKMQTDLEARSDLQDRSGSVGGYNCSYSKTYRFENYANGETSTVAQSLATQIQTPWSNNGECPGGGNFTDRIQATVLVMHSFVQTEITKCAPDAYPQFTAGPIEIEGAKYCYYAAEAPPEPDPCDCNDYRGDAPYSFESVVAPVGKYNDTDNMPQCITLSRANPDDIGGDMLHCECQVSAKKWLSFSSATQNGVEMERWEPYPVAKGQPSGTITGVTCADKNGGPEPPEDAPKDCYTLKSGVKWCWADPAENCTVINGQEQCSTGCGYVNGDFVCYEDPDPVLPDRPNDELNEVDDNITDPDKLMTDINKGDLKQIQSGTEQRLDNVVVSLGNNNNQLQNIGDKITDTNSKLDGIGQQLDGQGKSLKGIADGIGEAFGDDGEPEGGGLDGEGTWYESEYPDGIVGIWNEHSAALQQTPMFDFLNQFQIAPDGTQPDMNFCFNLGSLGDLGCKAVEVPAIVWVFLKLCILITAAFTCRALIFGG